MILERKSGILLHPTSLPGIFGIGALGNNAFEFVDFLSECGIALWQICPLGPTGYGDSPYQCFSAFAGNPLLIDIEKLVNQGLLLEKDLNIEMNFDEDNIDFGKVLQYKIPLLKKAGENFYHDKNASSGRDFSFYCEKQSFWLDDYSLFMALKNFHGGTGWSTWKNEYKNKNPEEINIFRKKYKEEILFHKFIQYTFYRQWKDLKTYANEKNISIIGDIPLFVSFDSADAWAHPEYFQFDSSLEPLKVAGVPRTISVQPDSYGEIRSMTGKNLKT